MIRPVVRHLLQPLHERLCGRDTFGVYRRLNHSQWWPRGRLGELQLAKLRELVGVALNRTEGYAEWAGVDRDWLPESLADLRKLPLLDKATLSTHREKFVNRRARGGAIRYRTGGSSGAPLIFYFDKRRQAYDKAARMRTHEWWGVRPGDREAYIWNSPVELSRQDKLKRLRDWLTNEKLFPASEFTTRPIKQFVAELKTFRPDCLFGYPSAIHLLCQLAAKAGLDLADIPAKVVFSTAEVLHPHQRQEIASALGGAAVVDGYGSREAGFIAHECPHGGMHITSENVIVEFVDAEGAPARPGTDAEIVVTQLDCHATPFIRYRTSDIGQAAEGDCPCGRGLELMKVVQGRCNDILVAPDGHRVHGSAVHAALSGIPGIFKYQLIQEADRRVRLLLVTDDQFPADGAQRLIDGLSHRLGDGAEVVVEYHDDIAPGPSGKFRYIISHAPEAQQGPQSHSG